MRLLNTKTLQLKEFVPGQVPDYVILSHRWHSEELTFEDVAKHSINDSSSLVRRKTGFLKVRGACRLAASDGYDWIWIDSCCIDKSSSADLQEAINSMWDYYAKSNICYVYMEDVLNSTAGEPGRMSFRTSSWFTRGWTLQELIAPVYVEFYAADWSPIGTKLERYEELALITSIDSQLLCQNKSVDSYSAAERLSWAAHRQFTREEDEAYALLGLFQINMPMLYGEGRVHAFMRLQEAIYRSTHDHSLFLFRYSLHTGDSQPLLADSPTRFCQKKYCPACELVGAACFIPRVSYSSVIASEFWSTLPHEEIMTTVTTFRNEMSAPLFLLDYRDVEDRLVFFQEHKTAIEVTHVAVLNHTLDTHFGGAFCLLLWQAPDATSTVSFCRLTHFPVLLPDIADFKSKMRKEKILICPGPAPTAQNEYSDTCFSILGDPYLAKSWSARNVQDRHVRNEKTAAEAAVCAVRTKRRDLDGKAEVSCRIAKVGMSSPQLSVKLEQIDETWFIKEVSELVPQGRQTKKKTLFLPKTPSDRSKVCLSDKQELYIKLRRSSATNLPINPDENARACYLLSIQEI